MAKKCLLTEMAVDLPALVDGWNSIYQDNDIRWQKCLYPQK